MARRCFYLRITSKKLYYLAVLSCWFVTGCVVFTRFQEFRVYNGYLRYGKVRAFLSASDPAGTTKSNFTLYTTIVNGDVHIYSAIARNSSKDTFYDVIALNGWEYAPLRQTLYYCCLYYDKNDIQRTMFLNKLHWNFLGRARLETKQFLCPNPRHLNRTLPLAVSLSKKKCPDNDTKYVQVETPDSVTKNNNQIAVCTKLAFGNLSASEMIEWFEMQKVLGVSKFVTYTHKLNDDAMKVLKHYKSEGLAEYHPFDLPDTKRFRRSVGVKNFQSWNDEQVVVLDCHARLAGYTYIGLYDMDEFVIPKRHKTIVGLLENLRKLAPRAAGFTFKTEVYATTWGRMNTNNETDLLIAQYLNRTIPMRDRVKSIIITDRVEPGRLSTHGYWQLKGSWHTKPVVPERYVTLKHYRSCRKEWLKNDGYKCFRNITRVTDTSMLKWAQLIANNTRRVEKDIRDSGYL